MKLTWIGNWTRFIKSVLWPFLTSGFSHAVLQSFVLPKPTSLSGCTWYNPRGESWCLRLNIHSSSLPIDEDPVSCLLRPKGYPRQVWTNIWLRPLCIWCWGENLPKAKGQREEKEKKHYPSRCYFVQVWWGALSAMGACPNLSTRGVD